MYAGCRVRLLCGMLTQASVAVVIAVDTPARARQLTLWPLVAESQWKAGRHFELVLILIFTLNPFFFKPAAWMKVCTEV